MCALLLQLPIMALFLMITYEKFLKWQNCNTQFIPVIIDDRTVYMQSINNVNLVNKTGWVQIGDCE